MRILCLIALTAPIALHAGEIDFNRDVRPILSENCFHCHGPDAAERKEELRLDTEEGAHSVIDLKNPEASLLLQRVHDTEDPMPPKKDIRSLTGEQKATLTLWIEQGATWAEHWAFVPAERPEVPEGVHPVDHFIQKRLQEEGLEPSPPTSPEKLLRRLSFDLTGLPPTLEEIDSFKESHFRDPSSAIPLAVDRLLSSPHYGEHMALPWLDAARYADTDGYQFDGPRNMWPWRDWVIEAYNSHMPFDQFTIEQLAGDLIPNATTAQRIATGFNRNHRYNSEEGLVIEEFLLENAVDRVDTTATLWMGLTAGCARCHDHKYDPISIDEYYELIAFFNSIPEAGRAIKQGNSEPYIPAPNDAQQAEIDRKTNAIATAHGSLHEPGVRKTIAQWKPEPNIALPFRGKHIYHQLEGAPQNKNNGPARVPDGIIGGCYQFDGTNEAQLNNFGKDFPFKASSKFTVSLWVNPEQVESGILLARQDGNDLRKGIALNMIDGKVQFDVIASWISSAGRATTKEAVLEPGKWTHILVTCDGSQSANGQHIYINGTKAETVVSHNTNSNVGGINEKLALRLGKASWSEPFVGRIDELHFFNYVLWEEEIAVYAEHQTAAEIAAIPPKERTDLQRAKLHTLFASTHPDYKEIYQNWTKERQGLETYIAKLPTVMVMKEAAEPKKTHVRDRGVYDAYGKVVSRSTPSALPPMADDLPRNRLGFAKWLVSGEHPLTARVAVNRYWQHFFGSGLVSTSEDFGIQASPPSHPELLDWLATEFVESGWDVQHIQKLILTSATYQQSSKITSALREVDPENKLLARGPRLRLTGQALRDNALFTSGLLTDTLGGPPVSPYQPANLWAEMSMNMKYKQSKEADLYRRSLYTIWKRTIAPPSMAVFDSADREACAVKPKRTNTPLQALALLNEKTFIESARHLAARIIDSEDPITEGFRLTTSRHPTKEEHDVLSAAYQTYREEFAANPESATALLSTGESPPSTHEDLLLLAATTTLANVLLNLDEAITKE